MAALPYIQLYVADYLADTMHLSTEEHGAYLLIIFNYWQTGKPVPKSRLAKIARLSNERWISVEASLKEFFNDNGTEWQHARIDMDLEAVNDSISQKSAAGKASAAARKRAKLTEDQRKSNDRSTPVENPLQQNANENSTNKDTDTDTDNKNIKKIKQKKSDLDYSVWPSMPAEQILSDWHEMRKRIKANVSQTVINGFGKELHAAARFGYTVDQCLTECITRNWRGFKFEWLQNSMGAGNAANQQRTGNTNNQIKPCHADIVRSQARRLLDRIDGQAGGDGVYPPL